MTECTYKKQEIKNCLPILLESKISSIGELDSIIKIILSGLFVEDVTVIKRYKLSTTLEVIADEDNKYKATIYIKGKIITVSGYYPRLNSEIRSRLIEILELEGEDD